MPTTPNRPRPDSAQPSSSGTSPASSQPPVTKSVPVKSIRAICDNIHGMFDTARKRDVSKGKGGLTPEASIMLRDCIHRCYKYIVFTSIKAGRGNPLYDIPPMLDPTLPVESRTGISPPLVDKEAWTGMIKAVEDEAMAAQAQGSLVVPDWESPDSGGGSSTTGAATITGGLGVTPVSSPGGSAVSALGSGSASGGAQPQPKTNAKATTSSDAASPALTKAPTRAKLGYQEQVMVNRGGMNNQEFRMFMTMNASDRAALFASDAKLKHRFEYSVAFHRSIHAKKTANNAASTSASSTPTPAPQSAQADQVKLESEVAINTGSPANLAAIMPEADTGAASTMASIAPPILGNPNFTLSQPPPPRGAQNQAQSTGRPPAQAPPAQQSRPALPITNSITGPNSRPNPPYTPALQALQGQSNPSVLQPVSAHHVDAQFGSYVPPPIPPPPPRPAIQEEPENGRRKRKYREWITEMASGLEPELGLEDILNDVVDKFIHDVTRSGIRLAKHRKSNRVEVKDIALYLDKQYDMTVPGFDAIVPKRTHLPVDTDDRRRLRAVIPRLAKRSGGEAEPAAIQPERDGDTSAGPAGEAGVATTVNAE